MYNPTPVVLSNKNVVAIAEMKDEKLAESLVQTRQEIAKLKQIIEVQEMAFNSCIEVRDKLAEKKAMEDGLWIEIQFRKVVPIIEQSMKQRVN
jgi:hypothetical protein